MVFIFTRDIVQVKNIKAAIAKASSLEEVERLNQMLRTGQIPGGAKPASTGTSELFTLHMLIQCE